MKSKFDDPQIEAQVIGLLKDTNIPVSIDFVAYNLNIGWDTARAILLNLALQRKISSQKTTKSFIFSINEKEGSKNE